MLYTYYDLHLGRMAPVTGRAYVITHFCGHPEMAKPENRLYAHKCGKDGWCVTHYCSGACVIRRTTKKDAIKAAIDIIERVGIDGFFARVGNELLRQKRGGCAKKGAAANHER